MIIPAVVIMAAAPVMMQAADFDLPANATCVEGTPVTLKGNFTFNNLDYVEIHYTASNNRENPCLIEVTVGQTPYSVEATLDGSEYVAKFLVKATNLAVPSISVSITGAGSIDVKSASATTGVYQGLKSEYNELYKDFTDNIDGYPETKKVDQVFDRTAITTLENEIKAIETWLDIEKEKCTNLNVASEYASKVSHLEYDGRKTAIRTGIETKAAAIKAAYDAVTSAITSAENALNTANTYLRTNYAKYTNDLARALQAVQAQRVLLAKIKTDNDNSLDAQKSDVEEGDLTTRVNEVTAEIDNIKNTFLAAMNVKDNAYTALMTQIGGVATQATDCPDVFAFKSTSFQTDKDAIVKKVDDARYKDDILSLNITTDINKYNAKVALYNTAVAKAKEIVAAYNTAKSTINDVPAQIITAKNTINGLKTTDCKYTDNDNKLSYTQNLNLDGKGAELASYENYWKENGTVIGELNTAWEAEKKLAYDKLGKADYASTVIAKNSVISSKKGTDLAAVDAIVADAQTLITAYNAVFTGINGVANTWTVAVNDAKNLKMYDKTGYTGFTGASYADQLDEQKDAIKALVQEVAAAASTTKTIAEMLAAVQAIQSSEWTDIETAISTLTATKDARETAFKTDALDAAKEAAESAWPTYVEARTNAKFVTPAGVREADLTAEGGLKLKTRYDDLVAQYDEYERYKNATVDATDYDTQLANFEKVSGGKATFVYTVNDYITALNKAQQAFAQNTAIYDAAKAAVESAKSALGETANNDALETGENPKPAGKYYGEGAGSIEFDTAQAYKEGRIISIGAKLDALLTSIENAKNACTLYDVWGHDGGKGNLQTQLDALNALIAKVDTDIDKAIVLQNTANALEVESLKTGNDTEVKNACASDFNTLEGTITTIKNYLQDQITYTATDKWVTDYESTFNAAVTLFGTSKTNLKDKLNGYQTQFNDRKTLSTLVAAAKTKIDAAWISSDYDAIEYYNEKLFTIEGKLNDLSTFVGTDWAAGTNYTEELNTVKSDLQKYAGAASVEGSIDAIVAASKANLEAKNALVKKAAALTEQLNNTISNLNANKIEVTKDGETTTKEYTFETEKEIAKKNAALAALNAFKNTAGEIFNANVAFSGKSVDAEIADRYALGEAATNQPNVENGILAFYAAINDVMVNLEKDYAGIVTAANEAVKTAFGTAYAAHTEAYNNAIAELQKYQDLPAGDFRDKVWESLTKAVTDITAEKAKADAKKTSFDGDDKSLYDADLYYDKGQSAKNYVEGCTIEIGNILSTFTDAVNGLAVTAFNSEIANATVAYDTAKGQVTSENGWTITTADFADVKKLIDDVQQAFTAESTALNYGAQVNALNDTAKGYEALITADKVKYADAQLEAYKKIGKDKADAAKTTVNGYKHLTDAHKSALISGIEGVLSAYNTNLTKGVSDLWSGMATVKTNSTVSYKYSNTTLSISSTTTIDAFLTTITDKALAWDTADWNTTVCNGLKTELAKVSAIYTTLNDKRYAVLTDAADLYEGWDTAAGEGQKRTELQGQLNDLNTWVAGKTNELNATHDRTWLAEAEAENGTLRTEIAAKYASLTGENDIVAVFEAANTAYTTWKNNKALEAYKASADVKAAVALAESWIPQNYKVSDTDAYTDIVAKVNVVKAAIAAADSAEKVDYLAFGKGTGTGDNIPALLVKIDKHNSTNNLIADMAADTKAAIDGFASALAAEKTKQAGYEEGAKSNFSEVDTKLGEVNTAYEAALGNGTLVFDDVQNALTDAVSSLTTQLNTLATNAAKQNTILVKTKDNEAGWTKVQGEYAEFEKVYNAAVEELHGYADVEADYTTTLASYLAAVQYARTSAHNTYNAFNNSTNKLTASSLAKDASIASTISQYESYIANLLQTAKAAQHAYDVQQACTRLAERNDELEAYWSTANNTLTNYNTTVQESFADEKQAVLDEMAEVKSNIANGEYALDNEAALTTQISDLYGKIDTLLALAADNNKGAAGTGDVDGSGKVTMNDYDTILNFILGEHFSDDADEQAKAEKAADVNNDDRVNVADLQGVLNIYHYGAWNRTSPQSNSRHRVAAYLNAAADNMEAEISGAQGMAEIALNLDNRQAYTSFQFDVKLPEGMQFDLVSLTERAEGLDVQTGLLEDGTIRVVATATDATIEAGTGAVARLNIATEGITDGEIVIDNIVFADNYANAKTFNGFALTAGTVTGIAGNATLTQRVVRSIYNAGGQLMDKVQQGINIIVGENGTAKKVIKK